ncbi:MAG: response regulator [Deltaproteobacteria bacterium]|nr:response regulator [Deltaproteobacteria bacterium]
MKFKPYDPATMPIDIPQRLQGVPEQSAQAAHLEKPSQECRFCNWVSLHGPPCTSCGGIDHITRLADFLRLRGVDQERLQAIATKLAELPESPENLILQACAELSLGHLQTALPLLRRASRGESAASPLRKLLEEVDQHRRGENLAHALLARERGELGDRKIILSVDDSATVRRVLEMAFTRQGHLVVSVEDAEKALESLSELRPDIVFVDFQLPGLDGLGLCRRLREESSTQELPVVILSGKVGTEFLDLTRRAGANSFVRKPASPEILLELLGRLTGNQGKGQEKAQS